MIKLKKQLKDETVKTHDKTIWSDIVNNLHLFQCCAQHINFCSFNRICGGVIPYKQKLLNVRNVFFHEIKRNLEYDCFIWRNTFCRVRHIGINKDTVFRINSKVFGFYSNIQRALLHINNFYGSVPVSRNITSRINRSIEFNICYSRYIYNFIRDIISFHSWFLFYFLKSDNVFFIGVQSGGYSRLKQGLT